MFVPVKPSQPSLIFAGKDGEKSEISDRKKFYGIGPRAPGGNALSKDFSPSLGLLFLLDGDQKRRSEFDRSIVPFRRLLRRPRRDGRVAVVRLLRTKVSNFFFSSLPTV